jgi:hypothetical protein
MIEAIHYVAFALGCIAILLVILAAFLGKAVSLLSDGSLRGPQGERGERGERGPQGERAPGPAVFAHESAAAPSRHLARVLKRNESGEYVHHGWVRIGSAAWQEAYDAPGMALEVNGAIEYGKQHA